MYSVTIKSILCRTIKSLLPVSRLTDPQPWTEPLGWGGLYEWPLCVSSSLVLPLLSIPLCLLQASLLLSTIQRVAIWISYYSSASPQLTLVFSGWQFPMLPSRAVNIYIIHTQHCKYKKTTRHTFGQTLMRWPSIKNCWRNLLWLCTIKYKIPLSDKDLWIQIWNLVIILHPSTLTFHMINIKFHVQWIHLA